MRLPGTFNHKQKRPVLVELNFQSDECRYDPAEITEVLKKYKLENKKSEQDDDEIIKEGTRNNTLTSIGGRLRAQGMEYDEILQQLSKINQARCEPPLPDEDVETIASSVSEYPAGEDLKESNQNPSQKLIELLNEKKH